MAGLQTVLSCRVVLAMVVSVTDVLVVASLAVLVSGAAPGLHDCPASAGLGHSACPNDAKCCTEQCVMRSLLCARTPLSSALVCCAHSSLLYVSHVRHLNA